MKLSGDLRNLKINYSADPAFLMRVLRNCILNEQKIFRMYDESLAQSATLLRPDPAMTIMQDMEKSRREGQQMEERIKRMHDVEEAFVFTYQDFQKRTAHLQQLQASNQPIETVQRAQQDVQQLDNTIKEQTRELHLERLSFLENLKSEWRRCTVSAIIVTMDDGFWMFDVREKKFPTTLCEGTMRKRCVFSFRQCATAQRLTTPGRG